YASDTDRAAGLGALALSRKARRLEVLLLAGLRIVGMQQVQRQQIGVIGPPLQRSGQSQAVLSVLEVVVARESGMQGRVGRLACGGQRSCRAGAGRPENGREAV